MVRRTIPVLQFLIWFAGCAMPGSAGTTNIKLSNGSVQAQFGSRGLVYIEDKNVGSSVVLTSDSFSITVDGNRIDEASAKPAGRAQEAGRITYKFSAGDYAFDIIYELRPGWRFVSKQILVTSAPHPAYRVDSIEVWRCKLSQVPKDTRVAKSTRIRQSPNDYGVFLRLAQAPGLFALVQNPFLEVQLHGDSFQLSYSPDMDWQTGYGAFSSDRGCLGLYRLTGREVSRPMIPEWKLPDSSIPVEPGLDAAEIEAFTDCVRAFLLYKPTKPLRMFVGWCVNDYQIDVATAEGRAEYKRLIDRAAELGAEHVLYAPSNSDLSRREESADSWHWENLLWLGLGQKIRKNEWNPKTDPIPITVQEMLNHAKTKNVKLVAYVYPVLPFSQNPEWLVPGKPGNNANLGFRSLQDFLIENLSAFFKRTGLGGYAFDYTFLTYPGPSRYAQWWGWRRVLETLRREFPDIVIDGRQSYMNYGPWIWLAGSYPHPTGTDEQPESFTNFPDLHFDRVSADRQRYTSYWYRNFEFCPSEIMPGFITHQTPRGDDTGDMPRLAVPGKEGEARPLAPFRQRDWDYLGWRYSMIASIATAGWNNVLNMIPARDLEEYRHFSGQDKQWFRKWLDWADRNKELLRHTRTITGEPAIGRIDGTAAIRDGRGFIFLFNPNGRKLNAEVALDDSIGLDKQGSFLLKEIYPLEGRLIGKPAAGVWRYRDRMTLPMDGASAAVLEVIPLLSPGARLFNAPGKVRLANRLLEITGVLGEAGTQQDLLVLLPKSVFLKAVRVNGIPLKYRQSGRLITIPVRFAGDYFSHSQQVGTYSNEFSGGLLSAGFRIPDRICRQLAERRKAWPIPWTEQDYRTTWLAPERLLLHVQIAEPDDKMEVRLKIDGRPVQLIRAYSSIHPMTRCFTGFYADVSALGFGQEHRIEVEVPALKPGQFQGLFFENVETEYTGEIIL